VKKVERGILILAPIIRKKAESDGATEPDKSSVAAGSARFRCSTSARRTASRCRKSAA
jgi:hypothetical protein